MKSKNPHLNHPLKTHNPELLFKLVFNQQFQFMAILSPEGLVLEVNDLVLKMQGVTKEDYVGKFIWESPAWRDLPEWKDILQQRLHQASSQRTTVVTEDVYQIQDGSIRYADATTTALFEPDDGLLIGYVVQASDTTERRLAEKQIHENENRLNFVLEHSNVGSWELDLIDHASIRTLKHDQIFGYDSFLPEWTYDMFLEHVLPDDRSEVESKFQESMNNKTNWSFDCRIRRKDGEIRWISVSGGHVPGEKGQIKTMAGIVQDITERKQNESIKLQYTAELKSLFQALPDLYFRMMPDGTILDFHTQYIDELYTKPDDFLGKRMQDVLPPDVGKLFQSKLDDMLLSSEMITFDYELTMSNEIKYFDARLNRIPINDQLVCVIRDVSEIKNSEEKFFHLAHHDALTGRSFSIIRGKNQ